MQPDICGWWAQITGVGGVDYLALCCSLQAGSGYQYGTNPPYTLTDFLNVYPKFFGPATDLPEVESVAGSNQLVAVDDTDTIAPGQLITGPGIPYGSLVVSIDTDNGFVYISNPATLTNSDGFDCDFYATPALPIFVMQMYINIASNSLNQACNWFEIWPLAMQLYIAHYCTLYMLSDIFPLGVVPTVQQIAAAGLQVGIVTTRAAGDVSAGITLIEGLVDWGSYQLTLYGIQFATFAKSIGSALVLVGSSGGGGGYWGGPGPGPWC
jgi:hypothetical protein